MAEAALSESRTLFPDHGLAAFLYEREVEVRRHLHRPPVVKRPHKPQACAPTTALSYGNSPTLTTTLSYLSFRAQPRNLQCAIRVPRIYRSTTTFALSSTMLLESCGFEQSHVVLFKENHISGTGESCEVGNPGSLGMTNGRGSLKA
jgi:hypothetical protein